MIDRQQLLKDLQGLLRTLEADLLERSESSEVPEVPAALKEEYTKAKEAQRTAQNYEDWRSDYVTQIAAAWVLSCVFARFLEDNRLVDPPKLAGPDGRLDRARDEHTMFFQDRERATQTDREYLLHVFGELAKLPGAKEIFGEHNPIWESPNWLSGDAAGELLRFFRRIDADTGVLVHDFTTDSRMDLQVRPSENDGRTDLQVRLTASRRGEMDERADSSHSVSADGPGDPSYSASKHEQGDLSNSTRKDGPGDPSYPQDGPGDPSYYDDTRFLGDLYQDLSEAARKKYALLQTPEFVEEFILDRTLDPAIDEFGLVTDHLSLVTGHSSLVTGKETNDQGQMTNDYFKMIDPACGSGHFLLGAFRRLFERWQKKEPGTNIRELAQRALNSVHGVDVNPYAVAISRFRLLLAAIKACGITRLANAPAFKLNLACGDSLYHGREAQKMLPGVETDESHYFRSEDAPALRQILREGTYHCVVANPPYIVPKDKAANNAYRRLYSSCHRQYSLAVPFMERIIRLAICCGGNAQGAGYTGQITANSFMKREFGKNLIEAFLPKVDLTHVIDTSGAYIPGHGTPTVILFGRHRTPRSSTIRTVMGIRGEPSTPDDPAKGLVWSAILEQIDQPGSESAFVSVGDSERERFHSHPWSIGGGGAAELKEQLDNTSAQPLSNVVESIGFFQDTHADEVFVQPLGFSRRFRVADGFRRQIRGDNIRDWTAISDEEILFPYDHELVQWPEIPKLSHWHWLFLFRTGLWSRSTFGGGTYKSNGRPWFDYHQFPKDRARTPLSIAFAFVATHNHFVLDRGGKVFNRSAPVIKLPADATEDDHLGLLGLLNSSTGCFWMKQVFHDKGSTVDSHGARQTTVAFENFREFTGTGLKKFPLPADCPLDLSRQLDEMAGLLAEVTPRAVVRASAAAHNAEVLAERRFQWDGVRQQMIALQEELDWQCYNLYGSTEAALTCVAPPAIDFGLRAFEIVLARRMAAGKTQTTWFERHGSTPITELPVEWSDDYRQLVERRIEVIETNPQIALIEQPEYKRRWNTEPWDSQLEKALRSWLLDRLECYFDFDGRMSEDLTQRRKDAKEEGKEENLCDFATLREISLYSIARLADEAARDEQFVEVGSVYRDDPAFNVQNLVEELVAAESVPLLPILRYKPAGLRKREQWEKTWELQRAENAIDKRVIGHSSLVTGKETNDKGQVTNDNEPLTREQADQLKKEQVGDIPVPPKYKSSDFISSGGARYWKLRGKLDVPKERWISFPHCEGEDGTLMIAWAGYDHLQLARAISAYYVDVQERLGGRDDPRLVPLLACLTELLPWLKQWHNEIDPEFGMAMGDYFEGFINEEARQLGKTVDEVRAWQPPQRAARRRKRRT